MKRTMNRFHAVSAVLCSLGACCLAGCAYGDPSASDAPVGEAQQAQVDPGYKDYLLYTLTQGRVQVGQLLVTSTAGGG